MDQHMARKVIALIFGVSVRDGELSDAELAFIGRVYAKLGVPDDRGMMPIADPEAAAASLRGMPKEVQEEALGLLIGAAAVDGVIHNAERHFLEAAAEAIGLNSAQLEERIVEALAAAPESFDGA
jgi:uncharacterized tellurite resistance protein B-like protein